MSGAHHCEPYCDPAREVSAVPVWLARLKGHELELQELSEHFRSPDWNVQKDEDGYYYLRSLEFAGAADSEAVRERALGMLEHMNGVAKLSFGPGYRTVEFDAVTRIEEDGQRYHTVGSSITISGRSRMSVKPHAGRVGSVPDVSQDANWAEDLVALAEREQEVADALRFFQRDDWVNLYKAWEIVRDSAGGESELIRNGWTTKRTKNRFTQTAQSREELGDDARHASGRYKPPKDPMSLAEAEAFVKSMMQAWMRTL